MKIRTGTCQLILVFAAISASAQTPAKSAAASHAAPAPRQAFEVASIRVDDPNSKINHNTPNDISARPQTYPSNRLSMSYVQMISLICAAYSEIQCSNVLDGPPWLRTNEMHYNLSAKVEGNTMLSQEQMKPLLRTLLEDRFHLKVHTEHRIVPGYAMVIAKGGSKLQPNKGAAYRGFDGADEFNFQNVTAAYVAKLIGWQLKQPVADKTGIQGQFDVDLKFRPPTGPYTDDPRFENLPSISDAVQEQLGLKLLPAKVPGDYLIIDHVDKVPTEN